MTFQQLRCLCQVVDSGFSVSRAALRLYTTQPGVSKMIKALESEAGVDFFIRSGNRLVGLTQPGQLALTLARRVLNDAAAIGRLGSSLQASMTGVLRLGTTHFHARYPLLGILSSFTDKYPGVSLELNQGNPTQITQWLEDGSVDIGVSTISGRISDRLVALKAYSVERCIIARTGHPLLKRKRITMAGLCEFPLIAYDNSFSTGRVLESEFDKHGLLPRIVMRAIDANVAKAYVAAGMGISLIPRLAIDPVEDSGLSIVANAPAFPSSQAAISIRKDQLLRPYTVKLITMINSDLPPEFVSSKVFGG